MSARTLTFIALTLSACAEPEPDHSIVTWPQLERHPHHPCAPLYPTADEPLFYDLEARRAQACVVEHCIEQVELLDPVADLPRLHELCWDDGERLDTHGACRWAACERLLPAMPGIAYKVAANTKGYRETGPWTGPIEGSGALFTEILELGPKASCYEVLAVAGTLEFMVANGQTLPWDLRSAQAALALARWHQASCPHARAHIGGVLYLMPDDVWEQLVEAEGLGG